MLSKAANKVNKRHLNTSEGEAPQKKLISDGDLLIKQLAEKQQCTKTTLQEQLLHVKDFQKRTEFIPPTNYTSGANSLKEFNLITEYTEEIENLKSLGLTNEDITLFNDNKLGFDYLKSKHKNIDPILLTKRLTEIEELINQKNYAKATAQSISNCGRHKTEFVLSTKPDSTETKLLKFALENEAKTREILPHPMDEIQSIEKTLMNNLSVINLKKIRKKARSLNNQITQIVNESNYIPEPTKPLNWGTNSFVENSKWDQKVPEEIIPNTKTNKIYTCQKQNYYTIKNGEIVKIDQFNNKSTSLITEPPPSSGSRKLSEDEIKLLPQFSNYERGIALNILYLKNLASKVTEKDLENLFSPTSMKEIVSIKLLKGKMRGQAFIEFTNKEMAEEMLNQFNGTVIHNKPLIIQFGKGKL